MRHVTTAIDQTNFIAVAMKISAPRNMRHYLKAVDAYEKQYPGRSYPSAEWFRRRCIAAGITYPYVAADTPIEVPEEAPVTPMPAPEISNNETSASAEPQAEPAAPDPVIPESEPLDLTPADGLIRKYRAFLRAYRNTADQTQLDKLLDAACPEIWED